MRKMFTLGICLICLNLTGCYSVLSKIRIIDIQQGNVITPLQIHQLRPGMSKGEVATLLGDPVLKVTFNSNRWDYVYTMEKARHERTQQKLTIFFNNSGKLVRYITE